MPASRADPADSVLSDPDTRRKYDAHGPSLGDDDDGLREEEHEEELLHPFAIPEALLSMMVGVPLGARPTQRHYSGHPDDVSFVEARRRDAAQPCHLKVRVR